MSEEKASKATQQLTIRLVGLKPGTSQEDLVPALQRLFRGKTPEEIRTALGRLPLILTRTAKKEQVMKVKGFLESKGAVLKITHTPPAPGARREVSTAKALKPEAHPRGAELRAKPRVHPGIELHPMDIGGIMDRSFRLLRQYFWLFFFIISIPQGVLFVLTSVVPLVLKGGIKEAPSLAMGLGLGISGLLAILIFIVLQFWAQGALIHAVSETYLGHMTSVKISYGAVWSMLGRLFGTLLLWGLLVVSVPALAGLVMAILIPILSQMGVGKVGIGIPAFFIVIGSVWAFFHLFMNWLLVDKVVVLEGKGGMRALHRSKELMKARTEPGFWKRPGMKAGLILLIGFLIAMGINMFFQIPGFILTMVMSLYS